MDKVTETVQSFVAVAGQTNIQTNIESRDINFRLTSASGIVAGTDRNIR